MSDPTTHPEKPFNQWLADVAVVCSVFSFVGSFLVMFFYWRFKQARNFVFEMVFWLALSDFLSALGMLIGEVEGPLCILQAWMRAAFELSSLLWSSAIAFVLFMAVIKQDSSFGTSGVVSQYRIKFHASIWSLTLVLSVLPFTTDSYGNIGEWCWIQGDRPISTLWRFISFYIPTWIAIAWCCWVYMKLVMKSSSNVEIKRRTMYYPLVLVICWIPPSVGVLIRTASDSPLPAALGLMVAITTGLFGFFNALVYGFTPAITQLIKAELSRICGRQDDGDFRYGSLHEPLYNGGK